MSMEFTYENQGVNTFLVWKLKETDEIDKLVKGMIENNEINGVLPLTYFQCNQDRFIKYNISSKISLKQYLSGMVNKKNFLEAMLGLVNVMIEIDDYMIDRCKVLLDFEHIYINVGTAQIGLVVLPIEDYAQSGDLLAFLRDVMFHVQFNPNENGSYIAAILNFLNSGAAFSILDFQKMLIAQNAAVETEADSNLGVSGMKHVFGERTSKNIRSEHEMHSTQERPVQGQQEYQAQPSMIVSDGKASQNPIAGAGAENSAQKFFSTGNAGERMAQPVSAQTPKQVMGAGDKKKEKFSLFGKKKEKEPKKEKKTKGKVKEKAPVQPSFTGGFAIPGAENQNTGNQTLNQSGKLGDANLQTITSVTAYPGAAGNQSEAMQQEFMGRREPEIQEVQMDFGETTVLAQDAVGDTTVLTANPQDMFQQPYVFWKRTNKKIKITKNEFKMGKEKSYVDFCVSGNPAVSRSHADIVTKNGEYFLRDNNSLNHTYIEDRQLIGGEEVRLLNGAKFKLADEEFEFWL